MTPDRRSRTVKLEEKARSLWDRARWWYRKRIAPDRFDERREVVKRRRSPLWQVTIALIAATIGAAALGYLAVQLFLLPETVAQSQLNRVPDLTGNDLEDAMAEGEDRGYVVIESGRQYSEEVDEGEIIYQLPPPETYLQRGDTLTVLVSLGPSRPILPDLAGLEPERARSILRQLGVAVTADRRTSSDLHPQGVVVESVPPPGTPIEEDTEVTLVLSRGGSFLTMPVVAGMALAAARDTLEVFSLTVGEVTGVDQDQVVGEGTVVVVEQEPAAYRRVRAGSAVRLKLGETGRAPRLEAPRREPDRPPTGREAPAEGERAGGPDRDDAERGAEPERRVTGPAPVDTVAPAEPVPVPSDTAGPDEEEIF